MKKEFIFWLFVVVLLVSALISGTPKVGNMAVDFTNIDNQYISFGDIIINTNPKTISFWVKLDTAGLGTVNHFVNKSEWQATYVPGTKAIYWNQTHSGTAGIWKTPDNSILTSTLYHVVLSYDNSSNLNNAVIYLDGVSQDITETSTPTGSASSDAGIPLHIGSPYTYTSKSIDGHIHDLRIYNRILSPAEVATIYSARGADNIRNGLVFCPFLLGARGLQAFDGVTLTADNTIIDPCSGALGVPAGSPVGVGETYLK